MLSGVESFAIYGDIGIVDCGEARRLSLVAIPSDGPVDDGLRLGTGADEHVSERAEMRTIAADHSGGLSEVRVDREDLRQQRVQLVENPLDVVDRCPRFIAQQLLALKGAADRSEAVSEHCAVREYECPIRIVQVVEGPFQVDKVLGAQRFKVKPAQSDNYLARNAESVDGGQPGESEALDLCGGEDCRDLLLQLNDFDQVGGFGRRSPLGVDARRCQKPDSEQWDDDESEQARAERRAKVSASSCHRSQSARPWCS